MTDPNTVPIDLIDVPDVQHIRLVRDDPGLDDLARSLTRHGLMNPITVRVVGERYQLIAGNRRLRAAKIAGWSDIRVTVLDVNDTDARDLTIIENLHRLDLTPIEEAVAIQAIIDIDDPPMDDLRRRLGKTENWINSRLALLRWPPSLQQAVHSGDLKLSVAAILARVPGEEARETLISQAIANGINARTASLWLQHENAQAPVQATSQPDQAEPVQLNQAYITRVVCACCKAPTPLPETSNLILCSGCVAMVAAASQQIQQSS